MSLYKARTLSNFSQKFGIKMGLKLDQGRNDGS
jgi:hypothetical protein